MVTDSIRQQDLFSPKLWMPHCQKHSEHIHGRSAVGEGDCNCPLGRPVHDSRLWLHKGKFFCTSCRARSLRLRFEAYNRDWQARSGGATRVVLDVHGRPAKALVKDACWCRKPLDAENSVESKCKALLPALTSKTELKSRSSCSLGFLIPLSCD